MCDMTNDNPALDAQAQLKTTQNFSYEPKADVNLKKTIMSWAYVMCQPNNGDAFAWLDQNINSLTNHLAAQGYIGVPEGYALVPIEPTREMILSGSNYYQKHGALSPCIPAGIYQAMLKAAPKKEGE
jgi:hypothetical protein